MEKDNREYVQSLERGIAVLRAFDAENARMTLSEVAALTGLTRATARRFLLTLTRLQLVASDGKTFWLLPGVLDLGYRYLSGLPWWRSAQPIIEEVAGRLQEMCTVSVLDGTDIVYVARAAVNRILSANISIGSRFPAFCTAMGRAMLSSLPPEELDAFLGEAALTAFTDRTVTDRDKLRALILAAGRQNYAISDGELEPGLRGLAVPILDGSGRAVAALGISVHSAAESQEELLGRGLPTLEAGARRIMESLKGQHFHPNGAAGPTSA